MAEEAFRHEVIAFAAGIVLFAIVDAGAPDYFVFFILMLVLFAVESLNTAIEEPGRSHLPGNLHRRPPRQGPRLLRGLLPALRQRVFRALCGGQERVGVTEVETSDFCETRGGSAEL